MARVPFSLIEEPESRKPFKVHFVSFTLVPEVYFYYFHCEGERKNKPLVESGNLFIEPRQSV